MRAGGGLRRDAGEASRQRFAEPGHLAHLARRHPEATLEDAREVGGLAEAPAERDIGDRAGVVVLQVLQVLQVILVLTPSL